MIRTPSNTAMTLYNEIDGVEDQQFVARGGVTAGNLRALIHDHGDLEGSIQTLRRFLESRDQMPSLPSHASLVGRVVTMVHDLESEVESLRQDLKYQREQTDHLRGVLHARSESTTTPGQTLIGDPQ